MPLSHRLLAVGVALAWGLNFVAIDATLEHFPPFFLVSLRFAIIAVPTVLFVPRPRVPLRWLLGYGLGFGTLQFLFLYWGMGAGFPAGLASLVLQSSAPFTVALCAVFGSRVSGRQAAGLAAATAGLAVVGWAEARQAALVPFLLVLAAGFGWAIGNVCIARAAAARPLHLVLWMSVVPPVPMLALALLAEGPGRIARSLTTGGHLGVALSGLAYTVLIGTLIGSGLWSWLITRHGADLVAPFSMLVPVAGLSASAILLRERLTVMQVAGTILVICGVLYATRRSAAAAAPGPASAPEPVR